MELLLKKNELLDLGKDVGGVCIACCSGQCWITQAGDNKDYILRSGSGFSVETSGQLIIVALEACQLKITNSRGARRFHHFLQNLVTNIKGHLPSTG